MIALVVDKAPGMAVDEAAGETVDEAAGETVDEAVDEAVGRVAAEKALPSPCQCQVVRPTDNPAVLQLPVPEVLVPPGVVHWAFATRQESSPALA